jgi:hypothetical protein
MSCGSYMDPPEMSRHSGVVEEQRQMHTYIRLLHESLPGFRALMTSARARLIDVSASQALGHSRLWARRSDRFAHHSNTLASYGRIPVLPHPTTVCRFMGGLGCYRPIDLLGTSAVPTRPAHSCWPRPPPPGSTPGAPSSSDRIQ